MEREKVGERRYSFGRRNVGGRGGDGDSAVFGGVKGVEPTGVPGVNVRKLEGCR